MNRQTKQRKAVFLDTLEKTRGIVTAVCEKTGVSRSTYYNWLQRDKRFAAKIDEILKSKADILEDRVYTAALGGDMHAATFMLKHIHPGYKSKPKETQDVHFHYHKDGDHSQDQKEPSITRMIWEEAKRRHDLAHVGVSEVDEEES